MGQKRRRRDTQVSTLWTRESSEGTSQPLGRRRFAKRACRYWVCRWRRPRRTRARLIRALWTWSPRCVISAAHTTSPEASLTTARPVVFAPGSSFRRKGWTTASGFASFKMRMNGKRRSTAALPVLSSIRARAGVVGMSGRRAASTTKTLDML